MNPIQIKEHLEEISHSLKEKNIIEDLPSIVKDLEFIIFDYPNEINSLTEDERINNIHNIEYHKIDYLLEFIKKYMELTWSKEFKYEIVDGYLFNSAGGYNQKEDIVTVSIFGMILNTENTSDQIKTIAHEYRHQLQYRFLQEENIEDILSYPPYFITIIKNMLPKEIKTIIDEEGYVIDKPYYQDNYKRIYSEVDANYYGLELSRTILYDLYNKYKDKNTFLETRINRLQEELIIESIRTEEELNEEKRIEKIYIDEIRTTKEITSKVVVDNIEEDALLYTDKCIKEESLINEKFKVLNILMTNDRYKTYMEILLDKYINMCHYDNDKIRELYDHIIKTDPILLISSYIVLRQYNSIVEFIKKHPTFIDEYKDELKEILNILNTDNYINELLTKKDYIKIK